MSSYIINLFLIVLIVILVVFTVIILTRRTVEDEKDTKEIEEYDIDYLVSLVIVYFDKILNQNVYALNLNKKELLKREKLKTLIRKKIRNCGIGDVEAKNFIKMHIKDYFQGLFTEQTIDYVLPFTEPDKLSGQDKFEILLYWYKKKFNYDALRILIENYQLDVINNDNDFKEYISEKNISDVYKKENIILGFDDKLEIITQRVYQQYKGLGVIDELRDMKIDEVSIGISGINSSIYSYDLDWVEYINKNNLNSYDSVWITYKGTSIKLDFLTLGSQKELMRVCKNIYRYNSPGEFSEAKGYIINEMKDGSRLTAFRPPFSAGWAAIVRKFDSIEKDSLYTLIKDNGDGSSETVIQVMKWLIKGYNTVLISGEKGTGKTTLLMLIVGFLGKCGLRTFELIFELNIPRIFPDINIISLRETANIKGLKALEVLKKAGGEVTLLGEIANYESANWFIEITQVLSKCGLGTGHWETTDALVAWFRNAILREGNFKDERLAEEVVVRTVNFDIHLARKGKVRYIERITEIIPLTSNSIPETLEEAQFEYYLKQMNKQYKTVDIVVYEGGSYVIKDKLSERATKQILNNISPEESKLFEQLFTSVKGAAYE